MSKIIQLAVALSNEGEESLYALTDDGCVLQRRWAANPRKRHVTDEPITYVDGWTEGWIPVENVPSMPVRHPEDTREES